MVGFVYIRPQVLETVVERVDYAGVAQPDRLLGHPPERGVFPAFVGTPARRVPAAGSRLGCGRSSSALWSQSS